MPSQPRLGLHGCRRSGSLFLADHTFCSYSVVLCTLIAHSFEEDTFGVVQRDIPRALEALLSFLSALEEYQMQLGTLLPVWTAEEEVNLFVTSRRFCVEIDLK